MNTPTSSGPRPFFILWFGQLITLIGSGLTSFALGIETYKQNGSTSELAMVILAFSLPGVLATPLAGALLDRWSRRGVLAVSALGCGLCTLAIYAASRLGELHTWEIYLCVAGISFFGAAQGPALSVLTALLVEKEHYGRANGLWQLTQGLVLIASPLLAATLLTRVGLGGIILIDFCSYIVAIATLAFVNLARSAPTPDYADKPHLLSWATVAEGWRYIWKRPGLLHLLCFLALVHFILDMVQVLVIPMALGLGGPSDLATIIAATSCGMMVGGIAMAAWGGPARRIRGVVAASFAVGLGLLWAGLARTELHAALGMFVLAVAFPIALSCNGAIWQAKVETGWQGRVFAFENMIGQAMQPIACLLAGPLTDSVFTPATAAMQPHTGIASFIEAGPGRGAALFLATLGALAMLVSLIESVNPRVHNIETDIPDADSEPGAAVTDPAGGLLS